MDFYKLKAYFLNKLNTAILKREVDEPILDLLNLINSFDEYFTTSSCAGRIVLMKIPKSGKKNEAEFLFKTHYETDPTEVWKAILENYEKYEESVWFKQEPFIIHIACKNLEAAKRLLKVAIQSGLKHSGIFSIKPERVMVEVQSTERVETIVAKNRRLLINEEYIKILVEEANKKLRKTRKKMKRFYDNLRQSKISNEK